MAEKRRTNRLDWAKFEVKVSPRLTDADQFFAHPVPIPEEADRIEAFLYDIYWRFKLRQPKFEKPDV